MEAKAKAIAAEMKEKLVELTKDAKHIFEEPFLTSEMEEELSNGRGEPDDAQ